VQSTLSKILFIFLFFGGVNVLANEISFAGEVSPWQEFNLKETQQSGPSAFQLNIESSDPENSELYISDLIDPNGKVIIKNNLNSPMRYRVPPKLYSTLRNSIRPTYVTPGLFSITVDFDRAQSSGTWKFKIAKKSKDSEMKVFWHLTTKSSSLLEVPRLKLDVLISSSFKTMSTNKDQFQTSLNKVKELYQSYGINLYFSPSLKWEDPLANNSDLEAKMKSISKVKRTRPTLYLVNRINATVEKDFQGLAGCLPGFQVKFVNSHCALLVSITEKEHGQFDGDKLTKVIAHEIAHLLGLFHLEDDFYPFGKLLDPFEDTSPEEDFINVMHKTSEFFGLIEFSQSQVRKMRSLPLLYQTTNL
jgi:hypothetical protein